MLFLHNIVVYVITENTKKLNVLEEK